MDNKKLKIANRCSLVFFACYVITYFLLIIVGKGIQYSIFLLFPFIFSVALVLNGMIKYNRLASKKLETIVGDVKVDLIKRYPSIEPVWVFCIILSTAFSNSVFSLVIWNLFDNINPKLVIIFSVISLVFLVLCQISSSFSLYYHNGKDDLKRAWKNIIIVVLALSLIIGIVAGPTLVEESKRAKERLEFQRRMDRINGLIN